VFTYRLGVFDAKLETSRNTQRRKYNVVHIKQAGIVKKTDFSKLTSASSVGDFVDVSGFASVVYATSTSAAVGTRQTVLRALCIHPTQYSVQQQQQQHSATMMFHHGIHRL